MKEGEGDILGFHNLGASYNMKEGEGDILGFHNLGASYNMKEGEGDILGDGKFSGFPNLEKKGRGREEEGKTHTH